MSPHLLAAAVLIAGFFVVALLEMSGWIPLMTLDHSAVLDAHRDVLASPVLLRAAKIATAVGSPVTLNLVTAAAGLVLLLTRRVRAAVYVVVVRVIELGLATVAKDVIARPRPVFPDPVAHASSFSFPSGHSAGSAAVFGALLLVALTGNRYSGRSPGRLLCLVGGPVVVVVAAVAASRVLLGVHYPSDVVAGVLLGVACVLAAHPIIPRLARPRRKDVS